MQALNQKANKGLLAKLLSNQIALGTFVGLSATYLPFALSFNLARNANLTAAYYSSSATLFAQVGFFIALLSAVAIYDCRESIKSVGLLAAVVFAMMGLLVSLLV